MSCAGDLEKNLILPFELNFAVVQASREIHSSVNFYERVVVEVVSFGGVKLGQSDARVKRHSFHPRVRSRGFEGRGSSLYRISQTALRTPVSRLWNMVLRYPSNLAWNLARTSAGLPDGDGFELLVGRLKVRIIVTDHFRRHMRSVADFAMLTAPHGTR